MEDDFERMMKQVAEWIKQPGVKLWRGTGEFGDRSLSDNMEYLLIQRSVDVDEKTGKMIKGITIQAIGVPKSKRRQGIATKMVQAVEDTAREMGLDYVLVQAIGSEKMLALVEKRGYQVKLYDPSSYLLRLGGPMHLGLFMY
jgi:GNAT superfamily N-acetyltransferase